MILSLIQACCRKCSSTNIVKNGKNRYDNQQYHCKDCKCYGVLYPKHPYSSKRKAEILRAYQERVSMRGITRIFGVARNTLASWISIHVEALPDLKETLLPYHSGDVLELDEMWSFVKTKQNQQWLWTAMCRRTGTPSLDRSLLLSSVIVRSKHV